jgi:hydroxymethylpyrimidine/phosphomethylpyrimidine kinase
VEAHHLAHEADTIDACAAEILDNGAEYVLITGTHTNVGKVINNLYSTHRAIKQYEWPRLSAHYQGAGATLASAIAGYLAHGLTILEAVEQAQAFTWKSLEQARRLGMGRLIPNRVHWCTENNNKAGQ